LQEITESKDGRKKGDLIIHYPEPVSKRLEEVLDDLNLVDGARERCRDERNRALSGKKRQLVKLGPDCMEAVVDASSTLISSVGMKNLDTMIADPAGAMDPKTFPDGFVFPNYPGTWAKNDPMNAAFLVGRRVQSILKSHADIPAPKQLVVVGVSTTLVAGKIINTQGQFFSGEDPVSKVKESYAVLRDDALVKVKTTDFRCPDKLICVDDDCGGWQDNPFTGSVYQLGFCTTVSRKYNSERRIR
jgi:hypothetical protein